MHETVDSPEDAVHSNLVGSFLRFDMKCYEMRIIPVDINTSMSSSRITIVNLQWVVLQKNATAIAIRSMQKSSSLVKKFRHMSSETI